MNYSEIIQELQNQDITVENFAYCDIENPLPNIGKWEEVEQKGGEGEGDNWYSVKYFKDHDIYIRTHGFYSSYDGTDFDDYKSSCRQVTPAQKTITVYESIS